MRKEAELSGDHALDEFQLQNAKSGKKVCCCSKKAKNLIPVASL